MSRVLNYLTMQRDWRLVVVAAVVCFLACLTAVLSSPASVAIALASVTGAVLSVGLIFTFAKRRMKDTDRLLHIAMNNMTQGVVMFEFSRLVVCNEQYLTMYGLSSDVVKPGASLTDIINERNRSGSLHRDPKQYCAELLESMAAGKIVRFLTEAEGRTISVVNRAIPGSKYWVGTHDDITERRSAERKSALLEEQEARRAVVEEAIAWFRQNLEGVLKTVAESVAAMKSTATAASELGKSISEINRQLVRATEVVGAVATETQSTNEGIAALAQAAQKIDDVVKLIQSVAGQTNLLALNATIEAARAGTAGRGFAVVASEVKALAVQTAKATDDIARQIAAVQSSTQSAVGAIGNIAGRMQEIREFTNAISTSIEEQNAATREISTSVTAAASGTKSVVAVLHRVSDASADMHKSADTVLAASQAVERAADSLRDSVDGFLRKVAI